MNSINSINSINSMNSYSFRPTWAQINLKALDYNFCLVRKLVSGKVKILVPVKSDAYGHGMEEIAKRLVSLGVDFLGVASIEEAVILRESGIRCPVLILSALAVRTAKAVIDYHLTASVCSWEIARELDREAARRRVKPAVHIKVDTGMRRVGVDISAAYNFIKRISDLKNLKIEGVFTHFPCADTNFGLTKSQIDIFGRLIAQLEKSGIYIPLRHTANSLGVINYPQSHFNLVRPGLMIYGLYPAVIAKHHLRGGWSSPPRWPKVSAEVERVKLRPILSLKTRIIYLKYLPRGAGISYGHTFIAPRKMRIATLPIGYGDGYSRSLSDKAYCLVGGKRAKIIGRICMDQMMVDVSRIKNVKVGDEAVLIGRQKNNEIRVEELAALAGTIPYEIVCNLGQRIQRIYF